MTLLVTLQHTRRAVGEKEVKDEVNGPDGDGALGIPVGEGVVIGALVADGTTATTPASSSTAATLWSHALLAMYRCAEWEMGDSTQETLLTERAKDVSLVDAAKVSRRE